MIEVITCTCGGADRTAREVLRKGGMENCLDFPIVRGKSPSLAVLDAMREEYGDLTEFKVLYDYVKKAGRFVVVVGHDHSSHSMRWADVSRGSIKEQIDGEIIVSEYM